MAIKIGGPKQKYFLPVGLLSATRDKPPQLRKSNVCGAPKPGPARSSKWPALWGQQQSQSPLKGGALANHPRTSGLAKRREFVDWFLALSNFRIFFFFIGFVFPPCNLPLRIVTIGGIIGGGGHDKRPLGGMVADALALDDKRLLAVLAILRLSHLRSGCEGG